MYSAVRSASAKVFAVLCVMAVASAFGGFDRAHFASPDCLHSPAYFWLWNDVLDIAILRAQIDDMYAHGMRSICVHPFPRGFRSGKFQSRMSPDYMTDGYLAVFSNVVDHAAALGMNVWLYDEGGWPSGGACGQVAEADGAGRYQQRHMTVADGASPVLVVRPYEECRDDYPSVIEKGAAGEFIKLTHERYEPYVGRHFGKAIRLTFTDEPTMPRERGSMLPWTADFADEFRRRKGYDPMPHVSKMLVGGRASDIVAAVWRLDYCDVASDLFAERYLDAIRGWDVSRGLMSSGHLNGEDVPEMAPSYGYGSLLRSYRAMSVPGVDVIWRQLFPETDSAQARCPPFPRYAASVAHQNGGALAMSESFGVFGDSMTPDQMKWVVDFQMVRGINMFVFGYYFLSSKGQWMLLFGPHGGPLAPWWEMERTFFRYVERMSALLASGIPVAEIAVYFDNRAFWLGGRESKAAAAMHYAAAVALDQMNCEYEFVDDDALAGAKVVNGRLRVGAMAYSTLVLPSSKWMSDAAKAKLLDFKASGGVVLTGDRVAEVPLTCVVNGDGAHNLRVAKRVNGNETLYFVVNEGIRWCDARLTFIEPGDVVLADPSSGDFVAVPRDGNVLRWSFPPCGSAAFVVGATPNRPAPAIYKTDGRILDSGWTIQRLVSHSLGDGDFEVLNVNEVPRSTVLGDWRAVFGEHFSGCVSYACRFNCDRAEKMLLDIGKVCWTCEVRLNGEKLSGRFFGPFQWEVQTRPGENLLEVVVANTLANAMSNAARHDRAAAKYPPHPLYERRQSAFNLENHESGLFGPVILRSRCCANPVR